MYLGDDRNLGERAQWVVEQTVVVGKQLGDEDIESSGELKLEIDLEERVKVRIYIQYEN